MTNTAPIQFDTELLELKGQAVLLVPDEASACMPSRGQVAVQGTINGHVFQTVLEPDGDRGHWLRVTAELKRSASICTGDTVTLKLEVSQDWPEPELPREFALALSGAPEKVQNKWKEITPMARWEWIRWINETRNLDTRAIRVEKTISKLNGEHRRPCCFNLTACTDPILSKSGKLVRESL